jgi:hypothetical protein
MYTVTNDISKATAWIAYPDENSCVKEFIKPNKKYKLIRDGEYFIKGEDGCMSMYYLCHKGDFIIERSN